MKAVHMVSNWLQDLDIKGARRLSVAIPHMLLPKPKGALTWPTIYGFSLKINPLQDAGVEQSLYYHGTYERGTLEVLGAMLREGDHFVDVGANIGLMAVYAARLVGPKGKVSAFEPHPTTAAILSENAALNALPQLHIHRLGLGSREEKTTIYDDIEDNRGAARIHATVQESVGYEILVNRMDRCLDEQENPQVVKIDVEGYELEVIKGMEKIIHKDAPMLIVESSAETNPGGSAHTEGLHQVLSSYSYRLFKGIKGKAVPSLLTEIRTPKEMPDHDNVYAFTAAHLFRLPRSLFMAKAF